MPYADNKGADQPAHPCSLISTFVVRCPDSMRGDRKVCFFNMIQRKVQILSKFCDVHVEIKYIRSNWMLFEKQL